MKSKISRGFIRTSDINSCNRTGQDAQDTRTASMQHLPLQLSLLLQLSLGAVAPSAGWAIEKYVINVAAGTGIATQDFFVRNQICKVKTVCPSDLGCGSLRSWCIVDTPFASVEWPTTSQAELHFVDSSRLADLKVGRSSSVDHWVRAFEHMNGNLTSFNGFMHNKLQLYSPIIHQIASLVAANGVPTMHRQSRDAEGMAVLHLSFQVAGRMFELVGPALPLDPAPDWQPAECIEAHTLTQPLSWYAARATGNNSMLVGISMTSAGETEQRVLLEHLQLTGARVSRPRGCMAAEITYAAHTPSLHCYQPYAYHSHLAPLSYYSLTTFTLSHTI